MDREVGAALVGGVELAGGAEEVPEGVEADPELEPDEADEDGPAEVEGSCPTQLVSGPLRTVKGPDWTKRPLESRRSRPPLVPTGRLAIQVMGLASNSPKSWRESPPVGWLPGRMVKK